MAMPTERPRMPNIGFIGALRIFLSSSFRYVNNMVGRGFGGMLLDCFNTAAYRQLFPSEFQESIPTSKGSKARNPKAGF
jgi:hypothetical protein